MKLELKWGVDWGLTATGFIVPSYDEVLDSVEGDFISRFGDDIVLTSNSNFGIIARLMAWREWIMMQELQRTYYSAFISTASNSALDRMGANIGFPRKVDRPSFAKIVIRTNGEYLIQAGEQFETEDGILFDLVKDVLTVKNSDGTWSGVGDLQSVETGAMNNVPAHTITIEDNPDVNVISVDNPAPAYSGQDYETDESYRARLIMNNAARPSPTVDGIKSALLDDNGVREVNIVQNPDEDADQYGNPPNSVHVYVLGGAETDIAETLVNYAAAGIRMVGGINYQAYDATGNYRTISFDFAKDKPIFVKVSITTNENWNVDEGSDDVKQAVADYINGLEMGDTIHVTKMYPAIYDIDGVDSAEITIGLSADNLASSDITCEQFEAPSCRTEDVEVTVDGV